MLIVRRAHPQGKPWENEGGTEALPDIDFPLQLSFAVLDGPVLAWPEVGRAHDLAERVAAQARRAFHGSVRAHEPLSQEREPDRGRRAEQVQSLLVRGDEAQVERYRRTCRER